jgi:DNA polymerase-4
LDSFFASVEVLDNPDLKGRPVIVGGPSRRGVVSTASYEARAFGARSGMPIGEARRLCPDGVFLPCRHERYREFSGRVMDVFFRYTPLVEPLSLDEAFLDVTGSLRLFGPAAEMARRIKREVFAETGLTITAGVASQKHLAKIASGMNKPDGLTVVPPGGELDFLRPLDLEKLWGAGKVALSKLRALGLRTVGDLADLDEGFVSRGLGESGRSLWRLANGVDLREVEPHREAQSVGAERTYERDVSGAEAVKRELLHLSVKVSARLREAGLTGSAVTLKMRDPDFRTITRSRTLAEPLADYLPLYSLALELSEGRTGPFRLLGIQAGALKSAGERGAPPRAAPLFPEASSELPKGNPGLSRAMDLVNARFGGGKLMPATLAERDPPRDKKR